MDVVVTGRQIEVTDRFREHVSDKLARLEKHDQRIMRVQVEVTAERNPRLADRAVTVQLTAFSKGPVVRAEAAAADKMGSLDLALDKLVAQLRKASGRRRVHRGRRGVNGALEELAVLEPEVTPETSDEGEDYVPFVVREKTHQAAPMSLDQALYEMELVGHDFYLFVDVDSGQPSVVYRRKGYDYGVIHLDLTPADPANEG